MSQTSGIPGNTFRTPCTRTHSDGRATRSTVFRNQSPRRIWKKYIGENCRFVRILLPNTASFWAFLRLEDKKCYCTVSHTAKKNCKKCEVNFFVFKFNSCIFCTENLVFWCFQTSKWMNKGIIHQNCVKSKFLMDGTFFSSIAKSETWKYCLFTFLAVHFGSAGDRLMAKSWEKWFFLTIACFRRSAYLSIVSKYGQVLLFFSAWAFFIDQTGSSPPSSFWPFWNKRLH